MVVSDVVGLCCLSAFMPLVVICVIAQICSAFSCQKKAVRYGCDWYLICGEKAYQIIAADDDTLLIYKGRKDIVIKKADVENSEKVVML